jgi:hypothetical protein
MRLNLAALALAAVFCLSPWSGFAAEGAPSVATDLSGVAKTPPATELADPAMATPGGAPTDADAPPPFVTRPKLPPQPKRPDMTYATSPAPTEFRGLAWGTPVDLAKKKLGLVPVTGSRPMPNTYHKPDELLKLGMADVGTVAYYFPKGVFSGAGVVFAGESNFFMVKDHLIELYGPGRQVGGRYGWTWTHVNIDLRLRDGMGELRYTYEP